MSDEFPRRAIVKEWTKAEVSISESVQIVESMGSNELLTEAVMLLIEAQNKVADFVDKK